MSISDYLKKESAPDGFNQAAKGNQSNKSANPMSNPQSNHYGTITAQNAYTQAVNPDNVYAGSFDMVKDMNRSAANANKSAVNAAADASEKRLSGQKRYIHQNYEENRKAADTAQRQALKELPENMAGLGLYGQGVGETAISNIRNTYANQLTELMKQRDDSIYDIDNQIEALRKQAEADIYNYEAQLMAQNPQYYLQLLQLENDENWRNKEWNYGVERDKVADERYDKEWNYGVERDKISDERYDKEWAYQLEQNEITAKNTADEKILSYISAMLAPPPASMLAGSSFTEDDINQIVSNAQRAAYRSISSGSSGGSSGGGGGSGGSSSANKAQQMIDADSRISKEIYSIYDFGEEYLYDPAIKDETVKNQLICAFKKVYNDGYYIKQSLAADGYTQAQAENKLEEYRENVLRKMQENRMVAPKYDSSGRKIEDSALEEAKRLYL